MGGVNRIEGDGIRGNEMDRVVFQNYDIQNMAAGGDLEGVKLLRKDDRSSFHAAKSLDIARGNSPQSLR